MRHTFSCKSLKPADHANRSEALSLRLRLCDGYQEVSHSARRSLPTTMQTWEVGCRAGMKERFARCAVIIHPALPLQSVSRKGSIRMVAARKPLLWIVWPMPGCIYAFANLPGLQRMPLPLLLTHVSARLPALLFLHDASVYTKNCALLVTAGGPIALSLLLQMLPDQGLHFRMLRCQVEASERCGKPRTLDSSVGLCISTCRSGTHLQLFMAGGHLPWHVSCLPGASQPSLKDTK